MTTDELIETYKKLNYEKEPDKIIFHRLATEINAYIDYRLDSIDKKYCGRKKTKLSILLDATSAVTEISIDDIKGKSRKPHIVYPRQLYCYLARKLYGKFSARQIGNLINRKYSNVAAAVKVIEYKYNIYKHNIKKDIELIKELL